MTPTIVVVGATGSQGAGLVSAYTQPPFNTTHNIRALTSNPTSDSAKAIASHPNVSVAHVDLNSPDSLLEAFKDATHIFANTVFNPETFMAQGPAATEARERQQGLNIVHAAAKIPTLQHFIWSTLPNDRKLAGGKYPIPHFQSKIATEEFARSPESGLAGKTTFVRVGMYSSNIERPPYRPPFWSLAKKHVITMPCAPHAKMPFIGDEYVNVGLIAQAIFEHPEQTIGRTVIGYSDMISGAEWAAILTQAAKRQGVEAEIAFIQTTLEGFEHIWGPFGTELGNMMELFGNVKNSFEADMVGETALHPRDLGVAEKLKSVAKYYDGQDMKALLA